MKKVNGRTSRSGTFQFSVEKGNIRGVSTFKDSGLANTKTVDIAATSDNRAVLSTRVVSKAHSFPKKGKTSVPINKCFRRVEKTIKSQILDNYYRPDLVHASLAKYTKVYRSNRIARGVKRAIPMKRGRA